MPMALENAKWWHMQLAISLGFRNRGRTCFSVYRMRERKYASAHWRGHIRNRHIADERLVSRTRDGYDGGDRPRGSTECEAPRSPTLAG